MSLAGCSGDRPPEEMSIRLTCRSLLSKNSSPRPWLCLPGLRGRVSELSGPQPSPERRPKSRRLSEGGKPIDAQRSLHFLPKPSCCPRFPSNPACRPGTLALSFAFEPCPSILSSSPLVSAVTLSDLGAHIHVLLSSFVTRYILIRTYHNPSRPNLYKPVPTCSTIATATSAPERRNSPLRTQVRQLRQIRTYALQVSGLSRQVCNSLQQDRCVERTTPDLACWPAYRGPESLYILLGV
jgi:hypothetical protein